MISKEDIRHWGGKDVFDPSGEKIGTIEDFYLDKDTYDPEWVIVKKGFLGAGSKLVPYIAIDWRDDHVVACYAKDMVDDSPGPGLDGRLSDEEEYDLMEHYGLARAQSGRMVGTWGHGRESMGVPAEAERSYAAPRDDNMSREDRSSLAEQAAAAHPFSTDLEDDDAERAEYDEHARARAEADVSTTGAAQPAAEAPDSTMAGEEVAGSTRLVRVKRYMVTERVEQVPLSEEEFEEGSQKDEHRRAA